MDEKIVPFKLLRDLKNGVDKKGDFGECSEKQAKEWEAKGVIEIINSKHKDDIYSNKEFVTEEPEEKKEENPNQEIEEVIKEITRPELILPKEGKSISKFAEEVVDLLKDKNIIFSRPELKTIVEVGEIKIKDKNDNEKIITGFVDMKPKKFVTLLEQYANVGIEKVILNEKTMKVYTKFKSKSLGIQVADIVLASDMLNEGLPQINRVFNIPLPIMYHNKLTFPKKGYDKRFGSWLNIDTPKINEDMELEDAKKLIEEVFKEFCFEADNYEKNKTMAIAGLLTPFLRGLYSNFNVRSPLFFYIGNRERTGKDYCAGVTGIVYEGEDIQDAPISTGEKYGNNNEELRKKYTGALIEGRTRMHFSNCKGHIENSVFENILTNPNWRDRIMKVNTNIAMPNEMDYSLSGNAGITYTRDLAERSRFIKLFYASENINERVFKKDLHVWVKENRSEIISALYALVKNWVNKGMIPGKLPFASFPEWAKICGGILETAGYDNPCEINKDNEDYGGDVEKDNMKQIFEIGYNEYPNEWVKKEKIIDIASNNDIYSLTLPIEKSKFMKDIRRYINRELSNIRIVADTHLKRTADHSYKFVKVGEKTTKLVGDNPTDEERVAFAEVNNEE